MEKLQYRVTSHGLDGHDHIILKSLINLLNLGVKSDWVYTDDSNADVVLVDLDTEKGKSLWTDEAKLNGEQVMIPISETAPVDINQKHLTKPLRSANLRVLFKRLLDVNGRLIETGTPCNGHSENDGS